MVSICTQTLCAGKVGDKFSGRNVLNRFQRVADLDGASEAQVASAAKSNKSRGRKRDLDGAHHFFAFCQSCPRVSFAIASAETSRQPSERRIPSVVCR